MNIITLDFETAFDDQYTLKKLTTEAYIRDPRFEVLGCAVKASSEFEAVWCKQNEVGQLKDLLTESAVICHHAHFDGLILSHHFGVKPKHWLDTLSMARDLHGQDIALSLESLAAHYGLGSKSVPYDLFRGKRWADVGEADRRLLADGCRQDVELTQRLYRVLSEKFPPVEYPVIDLTVRMFTEPKLVGDAKLFETVRDEEFMRKNERMYELGVGESDLQSATKFCALLEAEGVEIEMKEGKNGPIPAIAKTDGFMRSLCERDESAVWDADEKGNRIAELARARLEVRSTIDETRAGRFRSMAARGKMAVYLNYCGAHTRRWSGGDSTNFQNLGRGSRLRRGLRAPEGYLFAAPDQSQGECRILNWLAGQNDVVDRFAGGEDPYLPIATKFYGRVITKADKTERQLGKVIELACGYGMGVERLRITAGRAGIALTAQEAERGVAVYRETHKAVVGLWRDADQILKWLARKGEFKWRIFEGRDGLLYHPNGTWLDYSSLKWDAARQQWLFGGKRGYSKMYGAKLVENVVQWLSRIVTAEAMVKFHDEGYSVVGMSHDDVWLLVPKHRTRDEYGADIPGGPEEMTDIYKQLIIETMSETPSWAPGLPLAAECKIGETYS
jgi:hypothetical protein